MQRKRVIVVTFAFFLLTATLAANAQERAWSLSRETVALGDDEIAEYTAIVTSDEVPTHVERILYQDDAGTLLVIRSESTLDGKRDVTALVLAVELVDSSESFDLTVNSDGVAVATLAGSSVSFNDADVLPQSVKDDATVLLAGASTKFRDALRRLTEVGTYYTPRFESVGFILRELFFADIPPGYPAQELSRVTGAMVVDTFDPQVLPPGPFELQFGGAYFE